MEEEGSSVDGPFLFLHEAITMALILNLETTTTNCSVSLARDGKVISFRELNDPDYSHAENLHVFIEEVLEEGQVTIADLDAVAVSKGPGSYTGLRIGVSAAKGLCFSLNVPLIAVDTLQALAMRVKVEDGYIIPMLDARRMEVYSAVYDHKYSMLRSAAAEVIDQGSFSEFITKHRTTLVGPGAEKCRGIVDHEYLSFQEEVFFPSAIEMAMLSYEKCRIGDTEDVAYFEPFYLKDFIVTKKKA